MSKIEWTSVTWNPTRGCSRVSPGCDNCYAMGQARRQKGGAYAGLTTIRRNRVDWAGHARMAPEMLERPLRWRKPRMVFVDSMSDLFHESLSDEDILQVFTVMAIAKQHTFQVLTKRAQRMAEFFRHNNVEDIYARWYGYSGEPPEAQGWPLPNVWLGVSVESRAYLYRINELRLVPAAVRFLSLEPLLEDLGELDLTDIDWVIVGGESGHGARPCKLEWIRSVVRQCAKAGVACFVKQLGKVVAFEDESDVQFMGAYSRHDEDRDLIMPEHHKGADPSEWPEDLRVREWPKGRLFDG